MTPDRLARLRKIYEEAVALDETDRESLIEGECLGDPVLREEIEQLLHAHDRVPTWMELPALGEAAGPFSLEEPSMEGRQIAGYALVREIGRGGMGRVYLAERVDGAFQKMVAIKLSLPTLHVPAVLASFQRECQILASLDHPNIARLLDAGVTAEGLRYIVMEFVDGQPIDRWCDERKLNVSERIELFHHVMAAVQYAHQRLVVHRDLKPSNIYVSSDGSVKLLDFGIAKVLSARDFAVEPNGLTLTGVMTPEYASPEQANGAEITTLSDVYSLGVILYQLLTGHRPYRIGSTGRHELARVIAEAEPIRPSEVIALTEPASRGDTAPLAPALVRVALEGDPNRLRKRLVGDLDAILLMAIRKEPERRYSSVEAFAADLDRHLGHRPIAAREPTASYRLLRFVRRNSAAVIACLFVLASMLGGMVTVVWLTRREITSAPFRAVDTGPFMVFCFAVALIGLGLVLYFYRPNRIEALGALAGGAIWGAFFNLGAFFLEAMGWVRPHTAGNTEPLLVFGEPIVQSPYRLVLFMTWLTTVLFLVAWIQRRHGWSWATAFLLLFSVERVCQDRYLFSTVFPVVEFDPGWASYLTDAAFSFVGGFVGLLAMWSLQRIPIASLSREKK